MGTEPLRRSTDWWSSNHHVRCHIRCLAAMKTTGVPPSRIACSTTLAMLPICNKAFSTPLCKTLQFGVSDGKFNGGPSLLSFSVKRQVTLGCGLQPQLAFSQKPEGRTHLKLDRQLSTSLLDMKSVSNSWPKPGLSIDKRSPSVSPSEGKTYAL